MYSTDLSAFLQLDTSVEEQDIFLEGFAHNERQDTNSRRVHDALKAGLLFCHRLLDVEMMGARTTDLF